MDKAPHHTDFDFSFPVKSSPLNDMVYLIVFFPEAVATLSKLNASFHRVWLTLDLNAKNIRKHSSYGEVKTHSYLD